MRSIIRGMTRRVSRGPLKQQGGLTIPKPYLFYSKLPNGTGADEGKYVLPVECYAAVGTGFWFSDATTPIARTMTEVLAGDEVNLSPGNAFASERRGVAVYSPSPEEALERKITKYMSGTQWDILTDNGEVMTDNNLAMYEVINA